MKSPYFTVENHGGLVLFRPSDDRARKHLEEMVSEESQWFGGALCVEPRYACDLAAGLTEDGFTVRGAR